MTGAYIVASVVAYGLFGVEIQQPPVWAATILFVVVFVAAAVGIIAQRDRNDTGGLA